MSNYSNCRDSYLQYQHLSQSHNILYHEWIDDGILPTPDQIISVHNNEENNGDSGNIPTTNVQVSDKYWDYFCDDEQWEIFNPMNLSIESNGNIIFNKLISAQSPLDNVIDGRNATRDRDNNNNDSNNNNNGANNQGHASDNISDNDDDNDTNGIMGDSDNLSDNNNTVQNNKTILNKDNSDNDIIVGSAFDPRTFNSIKQRVNGWSSGFPDFRTR